MLDDYLDENLQPGQRAELERQLAADPALARLLATMKQERALRAAAYASFEPSRNEASTLAASMMNAIAGHQPAGYVGTPRSPWLKRALATAAAIAIVAGSFAVGRVTAPATPIAPTGQTATNNPRTDTQVIYRVIYLGEYGEKEIREFASLDEANDFANKLDLRRAEPQVAAVDLSSPGSF
jgi:anti-sigma factor RsiW